MFAHHQLDPRIFTCPHEVSDGFLGGHWHVNGHELIALAALRSEGHRGCWFCPCPRKDPRVSKELRRSPGNPCIQTRGQAEPGSARFVGHRNGSVSGSDQGSDGVSTAGKFCLEDFTGAGVNGCCSDGSCVGTVRQTVLAT